MEQTPLVNPPKTTARKIDADGSILLHIGDALEVMRQLETSSVDAIVCDPPYAISAIKDPLAEYRLRAAEQSTTTVSSARACENCDNPSKRTTGLCVACERDVLVSAFATGEMLGQRSPNWSETATHSRGYVDNNHHTFQLWVTLWASECLRVLKPGGHLVAFGGTRTWHRLAAGIEDAGFDLRDSLAWCYATGMPKSLDVGKAVSAHLAKPGSVTEGPQETSNWQGWGTGLKPAHEPIVLARKPLIGTVAKNVVAHGTGALNIDATRLEDRRWPSNLLIDADQANHLDDVAGQRASRFFWVAKAGKNERPEVDGVTHPTVKPLTLARELVRLVCPPGGTVLDPFAGSGTVAEACMDEGMRCVAIEKEDTYIPLIEFRVNRAQVRRDEPEDPWETLTLF